MRSLQAYKAYKNFFKGIRVFVLTFGIANAIVKPEG